MGNGFKKIEKIILRKDLWPRIELDVKLVQKYKDCLDMLPPVDINQNDILIDGYHRLMAFKSEKREEIPCNIIQTESEKQILKLAIQKNASFGKQLSPEEKKKWAIEFIGEMNTEELAKLLSVHMVTIQVWTKNKRDQLKEERDQKIIKLYLRAWNSSRRVAKQIGTGCDQKTVMNVIHQVKNNEEIFKIPQAFKPQLYDVWNYSKADNQIKYPGNVPQDIIEQLLYYYTEPFDIVFDPFGGGGITIDACKKWFRRYYVSDINILPEREENMRKWDITEGMPPDLPKPNLIFLDPPYYKKKESDYIKGSISSMGREDYLDVFKTLFKNCYERLSQNGILAFLMSNYINYENPKKSIFLVDYQKLIPSDFTLLYEIQCPLSTQQYQPFQVDKAKKEKKILIISRNLLIFKKIENK